MNPNPEEIEKQLHHTVELLENSDIDYWLDLGVLLGLVREGQPLEWDDDIEFGLWCKDVERLNDLVKNMSGFETYTKTYKNDIHAMDLKPISNGVKTTFVIYYKDGDNAWSATGRRTGSLNLISRLHTAYHWHIKKNVKLDPILNTINEIRTRYVPAKFYENRKYNDEFKIYVPSPVEEYLEYVYGDWETPSKDYHYWEDSGLITNSAPSELIK